jgi:hypothetical protein
MVVMEGGGGEGVEEAREGELEVEDDVRIFLRLQTRAVQPVRLSRLRNISD